MSRTPRILALQGPTETSQTVSVIVTGAHHTCCTATSLRLRLKRSYDAINLGTKLHDTVMSKSKAATVVQ
jgi:hypothetical protein